MNCATHNDTAAVAFCRTCGKPLCSQLHPRRSRSRSTASLASQLVWKARPRQPGSHLNKLSIRPWECRRISPRPSSGPNPTVAGILAGFFPFGVGAVYCSQYAKGLAHLLIFVPPDLRL